MNDYCEGALDFLQHAYDHERRLFSFSTRLTPDGGLVNDFGHPQTLRYTINTFLGVKAAEEHGRRTQWLGSVDDAVREFVDRHYGSLTSLGDLGLLNVLLRDTEPGHPAVGRSLARMHDALARGDAHRRYDMQELAWMLWGATASVHDARAESIAHGLFGLIRERFVHHGSGLPRHTPARYRSNIVSFGSLVYFLRAMHEHAERHDSAAARDLFAGGVRRALALQGPDGEWPWMIDVRTGVPIDRYPVFSVHQDSMAMLFLFPAQRLGIPDVAEAIDRSFRWNFGRNELGSSLVRTEPCFWVYRSIERDEGQARLRRYLRGLGPAARRYPPRTDRVRFNRECRSYHLGWVLYVWAGRPATPEAVAVPLTAGS